MGIFGKYLSKKIVSGVGTAIDNLTPKQINILINKFLQNVDIDAASDLIYKLAWKHSKNMMAESQRHAVDASTKFAFTNFLGARIFHSKHAVMDYAISESSVDGFVAEFGVFTGEMLNYLAHKFSHVVYGFDVFTGLPETWRVGYDKGHFDTTGMTLHFAENCKLYKGLFSETLPIFKKEVAIEAKLIHIDSDLYSSALDVLYSLSERIVPGTIIVFDEFVNLHGWENGEVKAWQEFVKANDVKFEYIAWNVVGEEVAVKIIKNP